MKKLAALILALGVLTVACGDDTTTEAGAEGTDRATTEESADDATSTTTATDSEDSEGPTTQESGGDATSTSTTDAENTESSTTVTTSTESADTTTITGQLTYDQAIALTPNGVATISVRDISRQDVAANVIGETTMELGDRQVPIDFDITVDTSDLPENGQYALRAMIFDAAGTLVWSTDTVYPVDLSQTSVALGTINLVPISQATGGSIDE